VIESTTQFGSDSERGSRCGFRERSARWSAAALLAAFAVGVVPAASLLAPQMAQAQNFTQRVILGTVYDDTGTRLAGATVFLKNNKTRNVKSFTSSTDGSFRFAQVGMVDDYEVWAEQGGKKSAVKTVSSFDSRKQVEFELKLK
jgi:hypothetical protein